MGILGILLGRAKLKKGNRERYFSIVTAADSLVGRTDVRLGRKAGLVFNPVESSYFDNLERDIHDLLGVSGKSTGTRFEITDDGHGTRWVVLDDPDFEDLVSTIHLVGEEITEHGFGDRLLAAVFSLDFQRKQAYWIYNVKRGRFYPFAPAGFHQRDNAAEMRLGALMEDEKIPVEPRLEQWYALWGIPF